MVFVAIAAVLAVFLATAAAYFTGARRARARSVADSARPRLEEYEFYPFVVNDEGHVEFDDDAFDRAVSTFLETRNDRAARELIVIGEQNLVRDTFPTDRLGRYQRLFAAYDGDAVMRDNDAFLENYRRIVHELGRSFPNTGIEILLHDLVNPSRSLVAIENGEVTGRSVGSGATNLVLDLKTRRQRGEDKVNYELNIGARQFKCTTIPIFRRDYGLVGAICVNIDRHFLREAQLAGDERLDAFVDNLLRTDFELDENILSKTEYQNALNGKRHYLDDAIRHPTGAAARSLAAIFFSDIVGYTSLMARDEAATLAIVEASERIHRRAISAHHGTLVKRLGDGLLARFKSASDAVGCALQVQEAVGADGRFQVRIGVHAGEIIESEGDVHGDGVNLASRIQSEVGPGEIGISEVVYENVRNKAGIAATPAGERNLKGVTDPVVLYTVGSSGTTTA